MSILIRPLSFLFIIFGGYALKRVGLFGKNDYRIITSLVINVTLPAAVVTAFGGAEVSPALLWIVALGFVCSFLPMPISYLLTRGQSQERRIFRMLNASGYNIGCFAMPFVQGYFGAQGAMIACMFDTGNAMMVTGGSYTIVSTLFHTSGAQKESAWTIAKKFLTSTPFVTYVLMLALTIAGVRIPESVLTFVSPISSANAFLAMLMLGMMFEPVRDRTYLRDTAQLLLWRIVLCGAFSAALYWLTPFELEVRQVLAIVAFAPLSALGPVYTERCRGNTGLASFVNSMASFVSLAAMTILVVVFRL